MKEICRSILKKIATASERDLHPLHSFASLNSPESDKFGLLICVADIPVLLYFAALELCCNRFADLAGTVQLHQKKRAPLSDEPDTVGESPYNRIGRRGKPITQVKFPKAVC
jgi:hypothetical protein